MAGFGVLKVASVMLILCMVVVAPRAKATISCDIVVESLIDCLSYLLRGPDVAVSAACCSGIKSLNSTANTTLDRQIACLCLKSVPAINYELAAGLAGKCGVSTPYNITTSIECNRVK